MVRRFDPPNVASTKIRRILDRQSVEYNKEKGKVRTAMYASDFGNCMRKVWFQFFPEQFPPDFEIDARLARIFENGNNMHERLQMYLKREPEIDFRDEVQVPQDELQVHGRCDGICVIDERAVVLEFKSINLDVVENGKEEHIGQLMFYLHMFTLRRKWLMEEFGIEGFVGIEALADAVSRSGVAFVDLLPVDKWLLTTQGSVLGELIYESKQTQALFNFTVEYDEDVAKKVVDWFRQLKMFVDGKVCPQVKYYPTKYPCMYGREDRCQFWNICHGDKKDVLLL